MVSGRLVHEGEVIGKVGNFCRRERATTYHLHFDLQVPTKYGWVFVNPYMTLVAAYERLIRGRGVEIREAEVRMTCPRPPSRCRRSGRRSRNRGGRGRKADRNGGRIARARDQQIEDAAR